MRVLALTKYGTLAASTRQRFLQYRPLLHAAGIEIDYSPLLDNDYLAPQLSGEGTSLAAAARGYWRRLRTLRQARYYDILWVHCELFPYLPGWVEGLSADWAGRPIVFDYDDAIFHMYDGTGFGPPKWLLEGKLEPLLKRAAACLCGNAYLRDYAVQYCTNSIVLPTVVDTDIYVPAARQEEGPVVIGWIGSPSTWHNVQPLLPLLRQFCSAGAIFRAIGAGVNAEHDRFPGMELIDWSEATEVTEVQSMDIGIMPLVDSPFERGKSGYKLIQYMACALPTVASPVGVNRTIVEDGVSGFLATNEIEWKQALSRLISDPGLRSQMGARGRQSVEQSYSLSSQAPRLIHLFNTLR